MDVFALLFVVSFLALILALVVMHIRKCMNKGSGNAVVKEVKPLGKSPTADVYEVVDQLKKYQPRYTEYIEIRNDGNMHDVIVGKTTYEFDTKIVPINFDFTTSIDKWQKSLPHPSIRLKNRKKRKGKK